MIQRFVISAILASVIHFVLAFGSLMVSFTSNMAEFDNPDVRPSPIGKVADGITNTLNQPGASFWTPWMSRNLPNYLEWGVFLANSLLWGLSFALIVLAWGSIGRPGEKPIQNLK